MRARWLVRRTQSNGGPHRVAKTKNDRVPPTWGGSGPAGGETVPAAEAWRAHLGTSTGSLRSESVGGNEQAGPPRVLREAKRGKLRRFEGPMDRRHYFGAGRLPGLLELEIGRARRADRSRRSAALIAFSEVGPEKSAAPAGGPAGRSRLGGGFFRPPAPDCRRCPCVSRDLRIREFSRARPEGTARHTTADPAG